MTMTKDQAEASVASIAAAIAAADGQIALAMVLGCSQPTVSRLARGEQFVSAEQAVRLERAYGIKRHHFRPDLYDAPPGARRKAAKKRPAKKRK